MGVLNIFPIGLVSVMSKYSGNFHILNRFSEMFLYYFWMGSFVDDHQLAHAGTARGLVTENKKHLTVLLILNQPFLKGCRGGVINL